MCAPRGSCSAPETLQERIPAAPTREAQQPPRPRSARSSPPSLRPPRAAVLAPMARRTASSFTRPLARIRSRFTRLTAPIRSSNSAPAWSSSNVGAPPRRGPHAAARPASGTRRRPWPLRLGLSASSARVVHVDLRLGFGQRPPGAQPRDHVGVCPVPPVGTALLGVRRQRQIETRLRGEEAELRRQHSHDRSSRRRPHGCAGRSRRVPARHCRQYASVSDRHAVGLVRRLLLGERTAHRPGRSPRVAKNSGRDACDRLALGRVRCRPRSRPLAVGRPRSRTPAICPRRS